MKLDLSTNEVWPMAVLMAQAILQKQFEGKGVQREVKPAAKPSGDTVEVRNHFRKRKGSMSAARFINQLRDFLTETGMTYQNIEMAVQGRVTCNISRWMRGTISPRKESQDKFIAFMKNYKATN
jgi:DNA mismatch repair ATPase MutL